MLIYLTGVTAGSLTVAIADPHVYLAGASGGVYALIAAHLANVVFNWREMEYPGLRLIGFIIIAGVDTGVAVYYRYTGQVGVYLNTLISTSLYLHIYYYLHQTVLVSYSAHIAGAVTGLLLGTVLLRNLSASTWERATWWCSLLLFLGKKQIFSIFTEEYFWQSFT